MAEHPITPPSELVQQWRKSGPADAAVNNAYEQHIATQAVRWAADQELEACCAWLIANDNPRWALALQEGRRPKPPSLKEQALEMLECIPTHNSEGRPNGIDVSIIRRALEQLDD